ncbi:MAG: hypothetical protein M5U14_03790 [Acidimicrobiia bacterium]|nr:hypothetical protein [Acidimicrobiia bacterium]
MTGPEFDPRHPAGQGAKRVEGDDPYSIVGVRFPLPGGVDGDREAARCFVEEYALMGWSRDRVRRLFTTPFYAGTYDIGRRRGPDLVEDVLAEVFGRTNEPEVR